MDGVGDILSKHKLLKNVDRKDVQCLLCGIMPTRDRPQSSIHNCIECWKGFHVNSFTLYHSHEALKVHHSLLRALIRVWDGSKKEISCKMAHQMLLYNSHNRLPFAP